MTPLIVRSINIQSETASKPIVDKNASLGPINSPLYNAKNVKFYTVTVDYWLSDSTDQSCFRIKAGTIVQLIFHDKETNMCQVKLMREIRSGLISMDYLEEKKSLNHTSPTAKGKSNPLLDLTPPTSPSTISSSVFSTATLSRGNSCCSGTIGKFDTFTQIQDCELLSIQRIQARWQYTLKYKMAGTENTQNKYYQDFYSLHCKLIALDANNLPNLPSPIDPIKSVLKDALNMDTRKFDFNCYLKGIIASTNSSRKLKKNFYNWMTTGSFESEIKEVQMIPLKLKILFRGDYYAIKCFETDINTLNDLQHLVCERLKVHNESVESNALRLTAKLEGWYIVELANEDVYQNVLSKVRVAQRLVLEVSI